MPSDAEIDEIIESLFGAGRPLNLTRNLERFEALQKLARQLRDRTQEALEQQISSLLDRIQPHLRHIPDVTHTEIEELRALLRQAKCPT